MALLTSSWIYDAITITIIVLSIIIFWINNQLSHWERKNVPFIPATFFFGNLKNVFTQKEGFSDFITLSYNHFKSKKVHHGGVYMLWQPVYYLIDPEMIKNVMQNDFQHFVDRGVYFNEKSDPLSAHLFSIEGKKWKNLRSKLTPTFTSGKMKMMFPTLVDCSKQLTVEMDKKVGKESLDIKDILARFTTDIIGSCAFGIECNSLKDPNTDFREHGRKFFEKTVIENMIEILTFVMPNIMTLFGVKIIRKQFSDFFTNVVKKTVEYREANNVHRKDFMHLMLQLKNQGKLVDEDETVKSANDNESSSTSAITFNELAAQAFIFFLAGFETSSTTMTFCLYELASNPEIQEKVREEVNEVLQRHNGEITYDAIMEMTYMEKVVNETLRKYPPLPILNRICTKDYSIPGTDLLIEKGTKVIIPVLGLQYDEEYYPDAKVFDPERFSEENKRTRPPYTFLPFGEGPRICIGLRFGMMQTKVGLTVLLKNYRFTVSPKTHVPLKMDPKSFILTTEGNVWLDYKKV